LRAGEQLKEIRSRLGITTRDVTELSQRIAQSEGALLLQHQSDEVTRDIPLLLEMVFRHITSHDQTPRVDGSTVTPRELQVRLLATSPPRKRDDGQLRLVVVENASHARTRQSRITCRKIEEIIVVSRH
jgi:hypothetical protein